MTKQVVTVPVAKQYLLERVGELRAQVPHGNPFVFLGAFSVLNALGKAFGFGYSAIGASLNRFGNYPRDAAEVVNQGARLMFEQFTLTAFEGEIESDYLPERTLMGNTATIQVIYNNSHSTPVEPVKKLNLSHKDRQHLVRKDNKLTLSANAFLEDVETVINKAFSSIEGDEVAGAKVFVKLNETPLIGYGE